MRKFYRKVFETGVSQYYAEGFWVIIGALFSFGVFKSVDYFYPNIVRHGDPYNYFGHLVTDYPWLQWVFQFTAFMSLGLTFFFFKAFNKAREKARDKNGAFEKVTTLSEKLADMDQQIRLERERYRKIIDRQAEFVTKFTPDGTITFVNKANYTFQGYDHWSKMTGKNVFDFIKSKDNRGRLRGVLNRLSASNPRERHLETMISYEGDIRYVDWVNCAIFDPDGSICKFQSVGRDITEFVEAQERVRISEEKYRLLFTHNIAGFAIHSIVCEGEEICDYLFIEVNPAFEKMFGFDHGELIGKTVMQMMPQTEPSLVQRFGKVAESGVSDKFHCYFEDINKWFDVMAFRSQENHFAATFVDISDWKCRNGKLTRMTD